jgi:glucan 1,3-beta-glucosidase
MLLHVTPSGSPYIENNWGWVADLDLDLPGHRQINVYVKAGLLVESRHAIWLYGTAYEHAQMYNYQLANAKNVYMGIAEAETP